MTAKKYREILARLNWTQERAGRFVGVDARTSRRYAGGGKIPQSVAMLLQLAVRDITFSTILDRVRD